MAGWRVGLVYPMTPLAAMRRLGGFWVVGIEYWVGGRRALLSSHSVEDIGAARGEIMSR